MTSFRSGRVISMTAWVFLSVGGIPSLARALGAEDSLARALGAEDMSWEKEKRVPLLLNTIQPMEFDGNAAGPSSFQGKVYLFQPKSGQDAILDLIRVDPIEDGSSTILRFPNVFLYVSSGKGWKQSPIRPTLRTAQNQSSSQANRSSSSGDNFGAVLARPVELRQWKIRANGNANVSYAIVVRPGSTKGKFELFARKRTFPALKEIGKDSGSQNTNNGNPQYYKFTTTTPGERVKIDMKSTELDSVITLYGPGDENSRKIASDDDSGEGNDAQLIRDLPIVGDYAIEAGSARDKGAFTLTKVTLGCKERQSVMPLEIGVPKMGTFGAENDYCQISTSGLSADRPYHLYSFKGTVGQLVAIDMKAVDGNNVIDPLIEARVETTVVDVAGDGTTPKGDPAAAYALVASNDDFDFDDNARVAVKFTSDSTLFVQASSFDGRAGDYTITVTACKGDAAAPNACKPE